ncbi:hypothetical protein QWZ13_01835 [Reinekea marina]|nr:hypothetical protein [Reinekea marina]MDN3647646.1 hypothetical protein [Reinekea marina]
MKNFTHVFSTAILLLSPVKIQAIKTNKGGFFAVLAVFVNPID